MTLPEFEGKSRNGLSTCFHLGSLATVQEYQLRPIMLSFLLGIDESVVLPVVFDFSSMSKDNPPQ